MTPSPQGPLAGLKILDLTRLYPGPLAGKMMAEMGAHVIKIEDTQHPDPMRNYPPYIGSASAGFQAVNRAKLGLALALDSSAGQSIFRDLLSQSDIVLEGFRPGVLAELGLGYEWAKTINPGIIYVSITGYGWDGPYAQQAGHDLNYIGYAGILGANGTADGPPIAPGVQMADVAGGAYQAVIGALTALHARHATGQGRHVDVAMLDGVLPLMTLQLAHQWAMPEESIGRGQMLLSGAIACYGVYACRDNRYMALAALEPKFWVRFCELIDKPEWTNRQFDQGEDGDLLREELRSLFKTRTRDQWITLAASSDICLTPVAEPAAVDQNPQLQARGMIINGQTDEGLPERHIGPAIKFADSLPQDLPSAPAHGRDSRQVLQSLGYDPQRIQDLIETGTVICPN